MGQGYARSGLISRLPLLSQRKFKLLQKCTRRDILGYFFLRQFFIGFFWNEDVIFRILREVKFLLLFLCWIQPIKAKIIHGTSQFFSIVPSWGGKLKTTIFTTKPTFQLEWSHMLNIKNVSLASFYCSLLWTFLEFFKWGAMRGSNSI